MSRQKNKLILGYDNLDRMRSMRENSVDLIYLDPPFNKQKVFVLDSKNSSKKSFSDIWTLNNFSMARHVIMKKNEPKLHALIEGIHAVNGNSWLAYLSYMSDRLLQMRRILKPTGSIYYHCDPTMSHGIKLAMDAVFGAENFLNEIVWCYRKWTNAVNYFQKNHDVLLAYKAGEKPHTFNKLFDDSTANRRHYVRGYTTNRIDGVTQLLVYDKKKAAHKIKEGKYDRVVYRVGKTQTARPDWWELPALNSQSKERIGYPTQKPLELLKIIIQASSNRGDTVFDPFCGCATTMEAAEKLGRKWIGIDISTQVQGIVEKRISASQYEVKTRPKWNDYPGKGSAREKVKRHFFKLQHSQNNKCYCNGCGMEFAFENVQLDHIHPRGKGGVMDYDNAQLLCRDCNQLKAKKSMVYLYARLADYVKNVPPGQPSLWKQNPEIKRLIEDIVKYTKDHRNRRARSA